LYVHEFSFRREYNIGMFRFGRLQNRDTQLVFSDIGTATGIHKFCNIILTIESIFKAIFDGGHCGLQNIAS
jgi:hypothetical protein